MRGCPRLVAHLTGTWRASARPWPSPRLVPLRVSAPSDSPLVPDWLIVPDDANALAPHVWPDAAHRDDSGELVLGGVAASDLRARFGTPLYVLDEGEVLSLIHI